MPRFFHAAEFWRKSATMAERRPLKPIEVYITFTAEGMLPVKQRLFMHNIDDRVPLLNDAIEKFVSKILVKNLTMFF